MESLGKILLKTSPKIIIINGDLKHEFGSISSQEWRETLAVLDFLMKSSENLILIKGNHDTILGPIAKKKNIRIVNHFLTGETLILHGNKLPGKSLETKAKTIIIGHEHPALSIRDGGRSEKFKCFLLGKWKRKNLIVQPSFNPITEGTDVLSEKTLSPFLKGGAKNFEAFVVADTIYPFGKLKNISSHL